MFRRLRRPLLALAFAACMPACTPDRVPPEADGASAAAAGDAAGGAAGDVAGGAPGVDLAVPPTPWATPQAPLAVHAAIAPLPGGPAGARILRGRAILLATADSLPEHVGNALRCTTCHLDEGRRPFAGPWTGVADRYPQYRSRSGAEVSLAERVNGCLRRSMNGAALDTTSEQMGAILAYFAWRSEGVDGRSVPGTGLLAVRSLAPGDPAGGDSLAGAAVYVANCARCHGADGAGSPMAPPLWGPDSYNEGAGMARESKAAAFIRANMPYDMPGSLTEREARDVAAYINAQPRPRFADKAGDWPRGDAPPDATYLRRP